MTDAPAPPFIGPANRHGPRSNKPIRRIVIHCTVSACAIGADDIAEYFRRTDRPASAHYVVDAKQTVQALYDSWVAYHAPPNEHSLGVELCCTLADQGRGHWQREDHQRMLRRAAELVAGLCKAYDVPIRKVSPGALRAGKHGICGHDDVRDAWHQTSHWDPGPYFPWDEFIRMVKDAAEGDEDLTPQEHKWLKEVHERMVTDDRFQRYAKNDRSIQGAHKKRAQKGNRRLARVLDILKGGK